MSAVAATVPNRSITPASCWSWSASGQSVVPLLTVFVIASLLNCRTGAARRASTDPAFPFSLLRTVMRCPSALLLLLPLALAGGAGSLSAQEDSLSCLGGTRLGETELAHGTTIVVVWASWSPRSRDIVERVNALAGRWGGRARVVTVNFQEERPAAERFLAGKHLGV